MIFDSFIMNNFSGSCRSTYKLPEKAPILPGNEAVAQCTREFSDISPLTGGNIAFPTLEGRPSAENFEESEILQVSAYIEAINFCCFILKVVTQVILLKFSRYILLLTESVDFWPIG